MSEQSNNKPVESDEPGRESGDEAATAAELMSHEPEPASESEPEPESEPAPETSASAGPEAAKKPRRSVAGRIARGIVGIAVLAGIGVAVVWWQSRPVEPLVSPEDLFVLQSLEDAQAALQRLEARNQALEAELAAFRSRVDSLGGDIEVLPTEIGALRRQLASLQGGQLDSRESWLQEQASYYLVLANTELGLGGRVTSAITALELADDVLRELGDPAFADVRRAIAAELQSLRGVEVADLERNLADLAGLVARVSELPMRAVVPQNFSAPEESLEDVDPGIGRLWERTKGAVTSIVRVERQEEPVAVLLTDAERQIVRRQLALELQIARTALFERREQAFRASLVAADGILNRDFDREAQSIIEARRLLAGMMRVEVEPELPRIGDSLVLLRAALGAQ